MYIRCVCLYLYYPNPNQLSGVINKIPRKRYSAEQDHLRMNVAPDQTIILGLQIFLDHRSLSSIGQKILMILFEVDDIGDDSDDDL